MTPRELFAGVDGYLRRMGVEIKDNGPSKTEVEGWFKDHYARIAAKEAAQANTEKQPYT